MSFSISIVKNGTLHRNPSSEVTESYVYSGDQNPIVLKREYDMTFSCDFDLVLYPFDTQYCFIEVKMIDFLIY
jgi:hypothetical protein